MTKTRRIWVLAVLLLISVPALCEMAWTYSNTYISNPVGPATVPQSSVQGGLVAVPNPVDTSTNLTMTGNIRGGMHFRGPMPYGSTTGFGASLGSSSLDSFLRYSSGAEDIGQHVSGYGGDYGPFYSPTGTVSMAQPGYPGLYAPAGPVPSSTTGQTASLEVAGRVSSPRIASPPSQGVLDLRGNAAGSQPGNWYSYRNQPLSRTPAEMEQVISDELNIQLPEQTGPAEIAEHHDRGSLTEQYPQHVQQAQPDRYAGKETTGEAETLRQNLMLETSEPELPTQIERQPEGQSPTESGLSADEDLPLAGVLDIDRRASLRQKLRRSEDRTKLLESKPTDRLREMEAGDYLGTAELEVLGSDLLDSSQKATASGTDPSSGRIEGEHIAELPALGRIRQTLKQLDASGQEQTPGEQQTGQTKQAQLSASERIRRTLEPFDVSTQEQTTDEAPARQGRELSAVGRSGALLERLSRLSGRGESLEQEDSGTSDKVSSAGRKWTFELFAQEKYDRYIKAAESYMKQARFYRAADAYTLASAYRPDEPIAYAGKAHALFAAGEYISSAVFLARAIELYPDYPSARLDLVSLTGGPALFEQRLADLEQCAKAGNAEELHFLLAYVYYRMGQLEQAEAAINSARQVLGDLLAVLSLQRAIGGPTEYQNSNTKSQKTK